jgi:hypothetical protein
MSCNTGISIITFGSSASDANGGESGLHRALHPTVSGPFMSNRQFVGGKR